MTLLLLFSGSASPPAPVEIAPIMWPSTVPQVALVAGYSAIPERYVGKFEPRVGLPTLRRRSTLATDRITFATRMTFDEYDDLLAFYRDTLDDGTSSFMRRHPRNPTGPNYEFVFVDKPELTAIGPTIGDVAITLRKLS